MGASKDWGKSHTNNASGFGKANNTKNWGKVKEKTESGDTDLKPKKQQ